MGTAPCTHGKNYLQSRSGWQGSGNPIPENSGQSEEAHTGGIGGIANGPGGFTGAGIGGIAGAALATALSGIAGLFKTLPISPLILDLDKGGMNLVALENSSAMFDLLGNNFAMLTGWAAPQNGLLAYDKNNNGTIDNIGELFGNATTDGFIVLDGYDLNNDNKINSSDAIFSKLRVWRDLDQDGHSDGGELKTLAQTAIKEISLNYTPLTNVTNQGHIISSRSTFTFTDNTTAAIEDVWFQHAPTISFYKLNPSFTVSEAVFGQPNIRGFGTTPDLWIKMTQDASLLQAVQNFTSQNFSSFSFANARTTVGNILLKWTGAETVAAGSRGANIDAKHLHAMEAMLGITYVEQGSGNPNADAGATLERAWVKLVDTTTTVLLLQTYALPAQKAVYDMFEKIAELQQAGTYDSMTPAQIDAALAPYQTSATQAMDASPLKWLSFMEYRYETDHIEGNFAAFITHLKTSQPSTNAARNDYWLDRLPLINAVADGMQLSTADYVAALTGTHLDSMIAENIGILRGAIMGTIGHDVLVGAQSSNAMLGNAGNDSIVGDVYDDTIYGGAGNDTIKGGYGYADKLYGEDGNDVITSEVGASALITNYAYAGFVDGGTGNDTVILENFSATSVVVNLALQTVTVQYNLNGTIYTVSGSFKGIENVSAQHGGFFTLIGSTGNNSLAGSVDADSINGGAGNDTVQGNNGNDTLDGGANNDLLDGGNDADRLFGGAGKDTLLGGSGFDTFVFAATSESSSATATIDSITGFSVADDTIDINVMTFFALDTDGGLTETNELRTYYVAGSNTTFIRSDQTNFEIALTGGNFTTTLTNADFIW